MTDIKLEFETSNNEEYKVNDIWDIIVYIKKLAIKQLLKFYYLVLWQSYFKEKIPRNLYQQSSTFKDLLLPITKIIHKS